MRNNKLKTTGVQPQLPELTERIYPGPSIPFSWTQVQENLPGSIFKIYAGKRILATEMVPGSLACKYITMERSTSTKKQRKPLPGSDLCTRVGKSYPSQSYTQSSKHPKRPSPKTTQPGHTWHTRVQFKSPETQRAQTISNAFQIEIENQTQTH